MSTIRSGHRTTSTHVLTRRAAQAARGFASIGIRRGDTIALFLRNDFPFIEASIAAGMIGAYPVPVNWHYTAQEATYLFEDSGAKAVVIHADLFASISDGIPAGVAVFVVPTPPEIRAAYGLLAETTPTIDAGSDWHIWVDRFPPIAESPEPSPGAVLYTSGTTARPKGVQRSAPSPEQTAALAALTEHIWGLPRDRKAAASVVAAVVGPMYHSAPNGYGLYATRTGAHVLLEPRFDPEKLLQTIETHRVTHIHMVPIMFSRLLKLPREVRARYDLSSLKFVAHAAAPISLPVKRQMIEWWGPVINEYYGATETGAVTFCSSEEWLRHPGTVGRAVGGAELRIVDENAHGLPVGETGEVAARNWLTADFTYRGDDGKRRARDRAGLIATGDVGYLDTEGYLYLCDRTIDMIISGGVNIYPAEIEAELHKMPGVADCAVFGIPDDEFGEAVCAVVQAMPGQSLTECEVRLYLRRNMAGYKVPKHVDFVRELPREDSGKIFKRKLRDPYWEGRERRIG